MGLFTERDEETPNQIILGKLNRIEAKLDALIKALHEYDGNDEYGESSFEAFQDTKNDIMIWDVDGAERRMDIIGQNGNTGEHYKNEIINNPATTNAEKKKRSGRKYYKPKAK
jgi:hypothetical protein